MESSQTKRPTAKHTDKLNDYRDVRYREIPGMMPDQQEAMRQQFVVDALEQSIL